MKLLVVIAFAAGLLAPILYTMDTLSRMRNKRVYPLIRLQRAEGRLFVLAVKEASRNRQGGSKTYAQVKDVGSTERRIA